MKDWENTLELLRQRGWDYGYAKCPDGTGSELYLVNLGRGIRRLTTNKSSIEEAVSVINRMAAELDAATLAEPIVKHACCVQNCHLAAI